MNRPLFYLDMNLLEPLAEQMRHRAAGSKVQWVYSTEHFAEIRRSSNPVQFLTLLDQLDARQLDLELIDWKMTGSARLADNATAFQRYADYCAALKGAGVNEDLFDPLLAWVNGGGDEGQLRDLPSRIVEQVLTLTESLPSAAANSLLEDASKVDLTPTIDQMVLSGNDINKNRDAMGGGKGRFGDVKGDQQLMQLWNLIAPNCSGVSADQFFGFDPIDKQGYETWPTYLGIIGCCAVLDILGFQAEKKCRKLERLPNVRSDAGHIAMGAFCSAIVSGDRRLAKRAAAIYEYKGIGTASLHLQVSAKETSKE